MKQCFFGEHLLSDTSSTISSNPVAIVESEKTALIAAHFIPDFTWLATGGTHGCFNREAIQVLEGREVILFPDLKATDEWRQRLPMLESVCRRTTCSALLEMGVIPVVNENDSVSSAEIETGRHKVLGDNDTLSAIVAELCRADLLVLLSDIDGLYDADPKTHPEAKLLHQVTELTPEILEMAGGAGSWRGTGGMATKLSAARIAMEAGCDMVITNGRRMEDLYGIAEGKDIGTRFVSGKTRN